MNALERLYARDKIAGVQQKCGFQRTKYASLF